ncbi:hypothetical protein BaRGS_00022703 [Batillaria attramentaria]|uniref:Uncharacterized protein n=1 Tax=Batillaria attramentaria TaxID=370345 RepID=A0ABD0KG02_9CAEN
MAVSRDGSSAFNLDRLHISEDKTFPLGRGVTVRISKSDISKTSATAVATGEHCTLNGGGDVSRCLLRNLPTDYPAARQQLIKKIKTFQVGLVYSCTAHICGGPADEGAVIDRVYHAIVPPVGPRSTDRQLPTDWNQLMKRLYLNLFDAADRDGKSSLALPLLGSGKAGATFDEAIEPLAAALQELQRTSKRTLRDINIHVLHSEAFTKLVSRLANEIRARTPVQVSREARQRGPVPFSIKTSQPDAESHTQPQNRPQSASSCGSSASGGSQLSLYLQARQNSQNQDEAPYKMESSPRGMVLIINIEIFLHPEKLKHRPETQMDEKSLLTLFRDVLGFKVNVHRNCTKQEMVNALQSFANQTELHRVDSCVVIVMSHGGKGDIIYGADGDIVNGVPQEGTFMYTSEIQSYFTSSKCPAMRGKPKLFIVQACRGDMEDTIGGPRPFRPARDVAVEDPTQVRHNPEEADMYILSAAVENYVAYRGVFVQLLCEIFRNYAESKHIKDLATMVHRQMGKQVIDGHILTISKDSGTLQKDWFLNPPSQHAPGDSQQ